MLDFKFTTNDELDFVRARFRADEIEASYRQYFIGNDRFKAVVIIVVTSLLNLAFIRSDYVFLGAAPGALGGLLAARFAFIALSIGATAALVRARRAAIFDGVLFVWTLAGLALKTLVTFTRPPDFAFDFTLDVMLVFFLLVLVPLPFRRQLAAGLLLASQSIGVLLFYKTVPPLGFQTILVSLLASSLLGAAMSWHLNLHRRAEFLSLSIEKDLRGRLERARDEIKVLRGQLPICSGCKKIRDDEQNWHPIENYIRERTEADFSHGICPDCVTRLYPQFAARILG